MRTLNIAVLSLAVAAAVLAPLSDADARGRGGHRGHHHHHGSVGVFFGAPLFPYYYSPYWYPRYYYPPAVVAAPAPAYIEQGATAAYGPAPAQQNAYWYFCPDSQTYYPYVQQCASQWQQVQPQASAPPQ